MSLDGSFIQHTQTLTETNLDKKNKTLISQNLRDQYECLEVQSPNTNPTDQSNKVNKRTLSNLSFGDWDVARFRI